jgi:hypothetical protein
MALLMIFTMEFARERLPAIAARMSCIRAFGNGRFERLGKIAHVWVEGSFVISQILVVRKTFLAEAIHHLASKRTIVDIDVPFASLFVREPLEKYLQVILVHLYSLLSS